MNTSIKNEIIPIFGFGYMRSGTTLLFNILKLHPDIFARKSEPRIIESLSIIRSTYSDLDDDKTLEDYVAYVANVIRFGLYRRYLGKPLQEDDEFTHEDQKRIITSVQERGYLSILDLIYNYFARKNGKKFWYSKCQVLYFDEIIKSMPEAVFIEIVRDPRAVLASKKTGKEAVWQNTRSTLEQKQRKSLEKTYDPLWDTLSWKSEIKAGVEVKEKYRHKIFSIRYEDLVSEPESITNQLCNFLNINFYEKQLSVPKRNTSYKADKPSGIGTESINKWKAKLTPEEIVICQGLTKKELKQLNYEHYDVEIPRYKVIQVIFKSFAEFFQRLYRRLKLGGKDYLSNIVRLYWRKFKKL